MSTANRTEISAAVLLLLHHGFTISRNGVTKEPTASVAPRAAAPTLAAPKVAAPAPKVAAPAVGLTADGRKGYVCGKCGQPGHNARSHNGAAPAPAAKPTAPAPKATPVAAKPAPKATTKAPATAALDDLDFSLDMGESEAAETPELDLSEGTEASAPESTEAPAEPTADPTEATDADLDGFLNELDDLIPG